jgi:tetratricopeptide (TPR) repeat protein
MLDLPGITLCCIDTANHALALRAMRRSAAGVRFGRSIFITDRSVDEPGIEVRGIAPLASRDDYSRFVLASLLDYVDTPHVLLVQWDGYALNAAAWRDDFVACDYIGAKWFWAPEGQRVGNGGFSLRSRRLLEALRDPRIVLTEAEDVTICRTFRGLLEREHAIRFASEKLADEFAFEAAYPIGLPFGFHGLYNFCRVVPEDELSALVVHFTPAIARSPQLAQLGRNCLALGQWRAAAAIFARILEDDPANDVAAAGLATARSSLASAPVAGRNDPCPCGSGKRYKNCHGALAASAPQSAASQSPAPPPAAALDLRVQQAIALHQQGDTATAERIYREALAVQPGHPLAQHFLGVILYQRNDVAAALPLLQRSVEAVPAEPEFHNNLGLALAAGEREQEAIAAFRAALALKAGHAVAWNNLGLALQSVNDVDGAIGAFRRAIALRPDFEHAHWNLALALLLDGQYAEGWREYESRFALSELGKDRHAFAGPAWDGSAPAGKTLLLYTEQGLGDALQFARFVAPLARAGARCIVYCPPALAPLLATAPGVAQTVSDPAPLPHYDAHLPLLSLPRLLGTTIDAIPADVPYIAVAPERRAAARKLLEASPQRLNVGIVWTGNPANPSNRTRSVPLDALDPLFDVEGIDWHSLQQGRAAADFTPAARKARLRPLPADWALVDTAALIAELDLVITMCTSIAHLSGALGRPRWTMLACAADWRWLQDRADSPWYPTMRLFRQPHPRDWNTVAQSIAFELRARVSALTATER